MENHRLFSSIQIKMANPNKDDTTAERKYSVWPVCHICGSSCTFGVTQSNEHTRRLLTRTKTAGGLEPVSTHSRLLTTRHGLCTLANCAVLQMC